MSADACEWESDNAKLQLEGTDLYQEFPFGCDTLQHVGQALIHCRKQRDYERKRADYLSLKLHHMRLLLQQEYERAEAAEDDCEDLAYLATKAVEKMLEGPTFTLEEVQEKYGLEVNE